MLPGVAFGISTYLLCRISLFWYLGLSSETWAGTTKVAVLCLIGKLQKIGLKSRQGMQKPCDYVLLFLLSGMSVILELFTDI